MLGEEFGIHLPAVEWRIFDHVGLPGEWRRSVARTFTMMHEAFLALDGQVDHSVVGAAWVFQRKGDTAARPRRPQPPSRATLDGSGYRNRSGMERDLTDLANDFYKQVCVAP